MITKVLKYEDFDGQPVEEKVYFHLSKSELIEMVMAEEGKTEGGLVGKLTAMVESGNGALIMSTFKEIIAKSYGERVDGSGSKFFKSAQKTEDFMGSLAFDALFTELMTSDKAAAEFVSGLVPADLANAPEVQQAMAESSVPAAGSDAELIRKQEDEMSGLKNPRTKAGELVPWAFRNPTSREQTIMSKTQLVDAMQRQTSGWLAPSNNQ